MKISDNALMYLVLISLFSIPVSADLNIEGTSVIGTGDRLLWSPDFSPDGNSIAYIAYDASQNQQIFTINIDGTGKRQVTSDAIKKWGVKWLNDEISFLSFDTDGLEKIFLIKPDGSGRRKLLGEMIRQGRAPEDKPPLLGGASWNPETKTILFTSFDDKQRERIYEVNMDGTGRRQVIEDELRQWNPDWSPDGGSFVYVSYDSRYIQQLFTVNADGTGKKQITFDDIKKSDPNWGQGGIIYNSFETISSSGEKLFFINPDGSGKQLLVLDGFRQINPRWSRDGTKILYEELDPQGNLKIKVLHLKPEPVQTPAVETPVLAPTETPAATPTETMQAITEVEETPPTLKNIVYSMLLVLAVIVVVMLAVLVISDILSRKK